MSASHVTSVLSARHSPGSHAAPRTSHVPALDGLRGIAILLVVGFHIGLRGGLCGGYSLWERFLNKILLFGWSGVDLFFVLSGFLITGILYRSRQERDYFKTFYVKRLLRVGPLYFGVLAVVFVVAPIFLGFETPGLKAIREQQGWLWAVSANVPMFLKNDLIFSAGWIHLSHFWSLAVEEHFYIIWPICVFLLSRRTLMWLCCAGVVAAPALRAYYQSTPGFEVASYVFTPCRIDGMAVGSFLALSVRGGWEADLVRLCRRLTYVCAPLVCVLYLASPLLKKTSLGAVLDVVGAHTSVCLLFGCLLVLSVSAAPTSLLGRCTCSGFLRFFGKYSYGIYVFDGLFSPLNEVLIRLITVNNPKIWFILNGFIRYVFPLFISISMAMLSWHLYESQFLRLRNKLFDDVAKPRKARSPKPTVLASS